MCCFGCLLEVRLIGVSRLGLVCGHVFWCSRLGWWGLLVGVAWVYVVCCLWLLPVFWFTLCLRFAGCGT